MQLLEVKGEGERELHGWRGHSGGNTFTNWGKNTLWLKLPSDNKHTHDTFVHKDLFFLLKISVSDIEPLTYLMWLKINELYTDTDVHVIQCNKAFVSSVRCKDKCPYVWMADWLIGWLNDWSADWLVLSLWVSLIVLDVSVTVQRHARVIHSMSTFGIFRMNFPKGAFFVVFFFLFKHSFSYLFIHS